jgi:hypothetical protein
MTKRRVHTHVYQAEHGAAPNHRGEVSCAVCHLPETNTIHQLPETTQAARDRDLAVLGEKEDL